MENITVYLLDIFHNFTRVVMSITVFDVLDILCMTFLIYICYKFIRETRAEQLLKGIIILVVIYIMTLIFQLKVMSYVLQNFLQVGFLAIFIVFQPELRRMLEHFGRTKVSNILPFEPGDTKKSGDRELAINGIAEACDRLHTSKTGALIVIERQTKLGDIIENATVINALPEPDLFCNLFYNKAPLHDGAVIIRENRIYAAGCFLPITNTGKVRKGTPDGEVVKSRNNNLPNELGSRHRAAVGMSENADALIIVVSEETGMISVAEDGQLTRGLSKDSLIRILQKKMPETAARSKKKKKEKAKPAESSGK